MAKNITILGSTGSIGTQTLDVVREIGGISIKAMTTNTRIELFEKQIREFKPELVCVMNAEKAKELEKRKGLKKKHIMTLALVLGIGVAIEFVIFSIMFLERRGYII